MNYSAQWISYRSTNAFSALATDYISQDDFPATFQQHPPSLQGIAAAIKQRSLRPGNRKLLVEALQQQYRLLSSSERVMTNITKLNAASTFTVCTAHQPNLFTGYLYFIYKILHAIKVADELKVAFPEYEFVPVYYMGSEDNDLEELNRIYLDGERLVWQTDQRGAVGRMRTSGLEAVIKQIKGQLIIDKYGTELISLLERSYLEASTIQEGTFRFVDSLFNSFGLVVLIADTPQLKKEMITVFEDDLFRHTPSDIVTNTTAALSNRYHIQVNPREINLFYMKDDIRERIVAENEVFRVNNTDITFSREEITAELNDFPERFSPNVVLRGLFQETILPNIAFIGGGSEIGYWLELKDLFRHYNIPYPVLLLRNSFLIVEEKAAKLMKKLNITVDQLFAGESEVLNELTRKNSSLQLTLEAEKKQLSALYDHLKTITTPIDPTLSIHVDALQKKAGNAIEQLEKKMIRAEKRKHTEKTQQFLKLKSILFPNDKLQERVENILPYYARYGKDFIRLLYENSLTFEQQFTVLVEQ
ncbi:MAG: bacillithiol biosynthesis cysteine-adding enzyme BshC [Sphingobacteriales bacterium]|nr:bacillithiol biosynthesis cysteine-adding enzyme BshC [Sphingobacteriales bacterium]OJY81611.1 MAG: bacillithiol biosynthesis cysteine-adding enzyme BshC [Sphingobacteriales bacterium 44-15]